MSAAWPQSYPGGKGGCYRQIINRMPPHRVYIETHLGGGAVLRYKRPAEYSIGIDVDADVIATWEERQKQRCSRPTDFGDACSSQFLNGDAVAFLHDFDWRGDELVYSDPPYVMSARSSQRAYYAHEYTDADHLELLDALKGLPCAVMISGYRCDMYDDALRHWRREDFTTSTRAGRAATESVWMNYPDGPKHEYTFVGDDFRERERIKKKVKRWAHKFANLPPAERDAILRALLKLLDSPDAAMAAVNDTFGDVRG